MDPPVPYGPTNAGGHVNQGLCPLCQTQLSADDDSLFCRLCGWRPTELSEDPDCGEAFRGMPEV